MIDESNVKVYKTKVDSVFKLNSIQSVLTNGNIRENIFIYRSYEKEALGKINSHAYKDESEIAEIDDKKRSYW